MIVVFGQICAENKTKKNKKEQFAAFKYGYDGNIAKYCEK